MTEVQAAEIHHAGGVFWGVQHHPEYTLGDVAGVLERYGERLVTEGFSASAVAIELHAEEIRLPGRDPERRELASEPRPRPARPGDAAHRNRQRDQVPGATDR